MQETTTYNQAVADILYASSNGDDPQTQERVRAMCEIQREFLIKFVKQSDGYMFLAAFIVAFDQMKQLIHVAQGEDKRLLTELVKAIIGSFGSSVQ